MAVASSSTAMSRSASTPVEFDSMSHSWTVVFDVNETLSDMAPLAAAFTEVGASGSAAANWFTATLRDGIALTAAGGFATFTEVGRAVLLRMFSQIELSMEANQAADRILSAFGQLDTHADIIPGVLALTKAGHRLVTFSNGPASIAQDLLARAGIADKFSAFLSVEQAGRWKPHPAAYHYAADHCGVDPAKLVLVAVHPWDIEGAHRAGLATAYLDRTGAPWPPIFATPTHRIEKLSDLAEALA